MEREAEQYQNIPTYPMFHVITNAERLQRRLLMSKPRIEPTQTITPAEKRLQSDIIERQNKPITINGCSIEISPYEKFENCFFLFAIFDGIFKVKITFFADYPFRAPSVTYVEAPEEVRDFFDMEGSLKLKLLQPGKWSPACNLNEIIYEIEMMLLQYKTNYYIPEGSFKKRKAYEYRNDNFSLMPNAMKNPFFPMHKLMKMSY
ncbi:MAG: hypothetical protein MJ252_28050 [archaeon]|nr:hypothetical protein [archaeon]